MADRNVFVLDTSALLALRGDEPGADRVETLLSHARNNQCRILISFMSRMEVLYIVWREEGETTARDALRQIDSFKIEWSLAILTFLIPQPSSKRRAVYRLPIVGSLRLRSPDRRR